MPEIFIRKFSEVSGGRFDSEYYLYSNTKNIKTTFLKEIATIKGGKRIPKGQTYSNNPTLYKYLRVDDLDSDDVDMDIESLKSIDENLFQLLERYEIHSGEIALSNVGTIGKIFVFKNSTKNKVILTENCVKISAYEGVLPYFLAIVLKTQFLQRQLQQQYIQTTIPKLAIERIRELKIPKIPPLHAQQKIIDIMDNTYKLKAQKEQEAKELLDSIDVYLLDKLGITMPKKDSESLNSRIFIQSFSGLSGTRFDSEYHQSYYQKLESAISYSGYPLVNLASLIEDFKKGIEVGSQSYTQQKEIPFVRVGDINSEGIDFESISKYISYSLYENLKENFQPKENELLYSKDGTIGICLKADSTREYVVSGAIVRLEVKDNVNIDFLQALLSTHLLNLLASKESIGAVIKHLNINNFLNLKIPLPPLKIQENIAVRINAIKDKSFDLKQELKRILQTAKIEVENLIMGRGGVITLEIDFKAMQENIKVDIEKYQSKIQEVWGGRYPLVRFGEVAKVETKLEEMQQYNSINYVDLASIDKENGIIKEMKYFIGEYPSRARQKICNGDLLISTLSGSMRSIALVDFHCLNNTTNIIASTGFFVIRNAFGLIKQYLGSLLRIHLFQELLKREASGAIMPTINLVSLLSIQIPLPPLEIQKQIATEITKRKEKAKNLQSEAKELLIMAKKEVEKMILGE